ncbi:hypothetical protein HMPREF9554_02887 [Treponema phagedenis F0421]|nr:hypothetical protein HMPREF9554_02887 [Treponema phagedenis F0421]
MKPCEFENFDLKFVVGVFKHRFCMEPRASVPVLILTSVAKLGLQVLKLYK